MGTAKAAISKIARYFPRQRGARFKTSDERVYGWAPVGDKDKSFLVRARGLWPRGHAGKVLKKRFRRLHRQGHHSVYDCLKILGLEHPEA